MGGGRVKSLESIKSQNAIFNVVLPPVDIIEMHIESQFFPPKKPLNQISKYLQKDCSLSSFSAFSQDGQNNFNIGNYTLNLNIE